MTQAIRQLCPPPIITSQSQIGDKPHTVVSGGSFREAARDPRLKSTDTCTDDRQSLVIYKHNSTRTRLGDTPAQLLNTIFIAGILKSLCSCRTERRADRDTQASRKVGGSP